MSAHRTDSKRAAPFFAPSDLCMITHDLLMHVKLYCSIASLADGMLGTHEVRFHD